MRLEINLNFKQRAEYYDEQKSTMRDKIQNLGATSESTTYFDSWYMQFEYWKTKTSLYYNEWY